MGIDSFGGGGNDEVDDNILVPVFIEAVADEFAALVVEYGNFGGEGSRDDEVVPPLATCFGPTLISGGIGGSPLEVWMTAELELLLASEALNLSVAGGSTNGGGTGKGGAPGGGSGAVREGPVGGSLLVEVCPLICSDLLSPARMGFSCGDKSKYWEVHAWLPWSSTVYYCI